MSLPSIYSTELPAIGNASFDLVVENAQPLISYIYDHTNIAPYNDAEIRVGLSIKILIKSRENYPRDLLQPIVSDLENMLADQEFLNKHENPQKKRDILTKELTLVNKYIELDDTISLNTMAELPVKGLLH